MNYDITTCEGVDCPLKDECYRHEVYLNRDLNAWVMVFAETPFEDSKCKYFWEK
jgi:hypothetical protein